eukprot:scaffold17101_cov68-Phaeocystis_antarctica.AAC.1
MGHLRGRGAAGPRAGRDTAACTPLPHGRYGTARPRDSRAWYATQGSNPGLADAGLEPRTSRRRARTPD